MQNLNKFSASNNDIIFVDGLWGTGKSIIGPIVSNMFNVERIKIEGIFEDICVLDYLDKITEDAAIFMLEKAAEELQYHNLIGRHINLRWHDDTGLKDYPNKIKLIRRLFAKEGDQNIEQINKQNIASCFMSHNLMLTPNLISSSFQSRLKIIEMVRHPLYMVDHFVNYLKSFERARELTLSTSLEGKKVPWFANDWKDEFISTNDTEKAVICIINLYRWLNKNINQQRDNGLQLIEISFEQTVFETEKMLKRMSEFLGRSHSKHLSRLLKKQFLPRKVISQGRGHSSYGWKENSLSDQENYKMLFNKVTKNCSNETQDEMVALIKLYDERYPSEISHFAK